MKKELFETLMDKIKVFEKSVVNIPIAGEQTKHNIIHISDESEKFKLIINKKGHRNPDNLSILLNSISQKHPMVRFDVNGADHSNPPNDTVIPTPHLHIFTDEYDNGGIAIPLSEVKDEELVEELSDSLDFFMDYTNISHENVILKSKLV
ncbi:DUF6978 family protein [Staphylococcus borealis]|nr:hypothetical protein [Staphylococcus sp. GDY8P47P]